MFLNKFSKKKSKFWNLLWPSKSLSVDDRKVASGAKELLRPF